MGRMLRVALALTLAAMGTGCIEWDRSSGPDRPTVTRYVSAVLTSDGLRRAELKDGTPPAGGGPAISAPVPQVVLLGGTVQTTVTASSPFQSVRVYVPGVDDYWELTLAAPTLSQNILIVISQEVPVTQFPLAASGALNATGGAPAQSAVSVLQVGTGDIQVNVTWNSPADVDLYLVDPSYAEVFYGNRRVPSGGELDLDSNAACGADGPRAENIFWRGGLVSPRGPYTVRVNHWSDCGAARTDYVVTINVRGQAPRTYTGFFTGRGVGGGAGAGRIVETFNY